MVDTDDTLKALNGLEKTIEGRSARARETAAALLKRATTWPVDHREAILPRPSITASEDHG
jgi:hypothetical protein